MAPFKSSLAKSAGKLLGVFRQADLSLRGATQTNRYVEPPLNATVTGGNVIYTYGNYKIHVFTSSGALTVTGASRPVSFEYVLIAGGGGGGCFGQRLCYRYACRSGGGYCGACHFGYLVCFYAVDGH